MNLAFFTENGRYLGRLQGRQSGNVLLRRAQYRVSEQSPMLIARNIIAAKIRAIRKRVRACALSGRCMCRQKSWASAAYWIWWKWKQKQAV